MSNTKTSKYPVAVFELIPASKNGANFVREDTIGTKEPVVIVHPKNRVIQSESVVRRESDTEPGVFVNVPTRYIYGQEIIDKDEQIRRNIQPNPKTDKIIFINGLLIVPKDGAFVGLYKQLKTHAQNLSNPDAPKNASGQHLFQPVFREIKPVEEAHDNNFNEFRTVEAIGYIKALVTEEKGKYIYNEERIDALSALFNIYAESPQQKTEGLIAFAKADPDGFLAKAKANEQTVGIEVKHAIALKVISFEGNTAIYVEKQEKIKTFPGNLAGDKKSTALANYFQKIEGREAYDLFKARLKAAKELSI